MLSDAIYWVRLAFEATVGVFGIRPYEEPPYEVVERLADDVEVRRYGARLAAEVEVARAGEDARGDAFRALFAYIAGANRAAAGDTKIAMTMPVQVDERAEKIAMTVPVETLRASGATRMRFFLPAKYTAETAPQPSNPRVRVVEIPGEVLAVRRFRGRASEADVAAQREALLSVLPASGWRATSDPVMLYYDAPFTLPFLRRNEAAVTVEAR
jgi:hypothetical protein